MKDRRAVTILIKGDWKQQRGIKTLWVLLFLCFALLCGSAVWINGTAEIRMKEAMKLYGSWHFAICNTNDSIMEVVIKNELVEKSGKVFTYGQFYGDGQAFGNVGTIQAETMELCGIEMKEGNLPEQKNDIAVEADVLSALGYSYELGQEIELLVSSNTMAEEEEEPRLQEKTYRLCGVLESYTSYYKMGNGMISAVITEAEASDYASVPAKTLAVKIKDGYNSKSVREDLFYATHQNLFLETEEWIENEFVYGDDFIKKNVDTIQGVLLLLLFFMTVGISLSYADKQRKRSGILETLGMPKEEIIKNILLEQGILWITALFLGCLAGTGIALAGIYLYGRRQEVVDFIQIPILPLLLCCIVGSLVFCMGIALSVLLLRGKSSIHKMRQVGKIGVNDRAVNQMKGNYSKELLKRERTFKKKQFILIIFMETMLCTAIGILLYQTGNYAGKYFITKDNYASDYVIGHSPTLQYYHESITGVISEELLKKLNNIEGVDSMETIYWNPHMQIVWEDKEESSYYEESLAFFQSRDGKFEIPILGMQENGELIKDVEESLAEGSLDRKAFSSGEEVLLYLPIQTYENSTRIETISYQNYLQYPSHYQGYKEDTIQAGEKLYISCGEMEKEVTVAGILYDYTDRKLGNKISMYPYSIIGSEELVRTLTNKLPEGNQSVTFVETNKKASYLSTDKRVADLVSKAGMKVTNLREEMSAGLEYCFKNIVLLSILLLSLVGVQFIFLKVFLLREKQEKHKKIAILFALGEEKRELKKFLTASFSRVFLKSVIFSYFLMGIYFSIEHCLQGFDAGLLMPAYWFVLFIYTPEGKLYLGLIFFLFLLINLLQNREIKKIEKKVLEEIRK